MGQIFAIILSGCSHDAAMCQIVERAELAADSKEACETIMLSKMNALDVEYPVLQGFCAPLIVADLQIS